MVVLQLIMTPERPTHGEYFLLDMCATYAGTKVKEISKVRCQTRLTTKVGWSVLSAGEICLYTSDVLDFPC
jgi:hypothetical protein